MNYYHHDVWSFVTHIAVASLGSDFDQIARLLLAEYPYCSLLLLFDHISYQQNSTFLKFSGELGHVFIDPVVGEWIKDITSVRKPYVANSCSIGADSQIALESLSRQIMFPQQRL